MRFLFERFLVSGNLDTPTLWPHIRESRHVLTGAPGVHGSALAMQYGACLVSWNFIGRCRTHAENACHAAVLIRVQRASSVINWIAFVPEGTKTLESRRRVFASLKLCLAFINLNPFSDAITSP